MYRRLKPVPCCFALALALRLAYVLTLPDQTVFPDESRFLHAAASFARDFSLSSGKLAHDMPLMGVVNGLVLLCGGGLTAIRLLQALGSALLVPVVCALAARIQPGDASRWFAGLVTACYPFFIFYSGTVLSETWFVLFTAAFFLSLARMGQAGSPTGLMAGLAHLTRPTLIYFLPVAAAWALVVRRVPARRVLLAAAVFCLLLIPWVVRNYQAFGVFMVTNTGGGQNLWDANNPWNPHGGVPEDPTFMTLVPKDLSEMEEDRHMKKLALDHLKEDPARTARLMVSKMHRFWNLWPNAESYSRGLYRYVALASFGPVLLLAVAGLWVLRDRWREWGILWLFVGYLSVLHMVAMGSIRYRLPLEPLLIACAGACAARLLHGLGRGSSTGVAAGGEKS